MDEVVKPLQFIEENHNELYLKAKDFMKQNGIGENDIKRIVTRSGNEEDYGLFTYKNSFWFEPIDKYIKNIEEIKGIAEDNRNCIEVWRDWYGLQ